MSRLDTEKNWPSLIEWANAGWFRLRHSRLVDNAVALYVVHFANYLLPLITVPYVVRVLTPSGFGLGAFAVSFAGFFGTVADYGFNLTATRAVSVNRDSHHEVSRIATQVMFTKAVMLGHCAGIFWLLTWAVPKLQGNNLVMWMGFLQVAVGSLTPFWLYQGLEELRFSSRVNLAARVAYVPALFLFVRRPADTWKWMLLQAVVAVISAGILWLNAWLRLGVGWVRPRWADLQSQLKEGFSLFVSQAAVKAYTSGNTFILGMFTNMTIAGYYSAAERVVQMILALLGPVSQAVYPRAVQLAASSREAALQLTRKMMLFMGTAGLGLSAGVLVTAPWLVPVLLGARFQPSITIMQILSPLPFLIALSNVLGIQIMVPFKHDVAFTVILVAAGLLNLGMASLLAPHWQGNGMAVSVTFSELLVTAAMFWYLGRRRLLPLVPLQPEAASV
jgi:PST family polysaccharide transporter